MGLKPPSNGFPAVLETRALQMTLDIVEQVIGKHRDEEMGLHALRFAVMDRPQTQFAFQTAKSLFYRSQHDI